MVKRTRLNMIIGILLILFLGASCSIKKDGLSTKPQTNNGKKWRVGYLEGGPFISYPCPQPFQGSIFSFFYSR